MKSFSVIAAKATRDIEVVFSDDSYEECSSFQNTLYESWKILHKLNLASSGVSMIIINTSDLDLIKSDRMTLGKLAIHKAGAY